MEFGLGILPKNRKDLPRKDKSTAHRATQSPTTARKGGTLGAEGGPAKCLNRPRKGRPRLDFWFEIFLGGSRHPGGASIFPGMIF